MASITYGTSEIKGEGSFRIPFGIFFIIPAIVSVGAWFMVEVSFSEPFFFRC
jgi:MFS transporter, SP family, sugar:H+ symporter